MMHLDALLIAAKLIEEYRHEYTAQINFNKGRRTTSDILAQQIAGVRARIKKISFMNR